MTKPEIGAIRIFGRETKFEIVPAAAERFATAIKGAHDDGVKIEPAGAPEPRTSGPRGAGPRMTMSGKPFSRPRKDFGPREEQGERKPWSPVDGGDPQERPPRPRPEGGKPLFKEGGKPPFKKKPGGKPFKKAKP